MATKKASLLITLKDQISKGLNRVRQNIKKIAVTATAMGASITAMAVKAIKAFARQESAENAVASALASHGDQVDALMPKMKALAAAIQKQTTYGDENVLSLMAQIRNLGVMPENMEKATKGAIGLAKALNLDANAAARYTALALQGEYTVLQRYVPALRTATTEAEKQKIVTDLMAKGYKQAQEETNTLSGRVAQLKNRLGDLFEVIGKILLPAVNSLISVAEKLVSWFENLSPASKKLTVILVGLSGVVVSLVGALSGLSLILPSILSGFNMLLPLLGPFAIALGAITAAVVKLTAEFLKLNDAIKEQNDAVNNFLGKQKEVQNKVREGVEIWKKYGDESVNAIMRQGISMEEAKTAMEGMFALASQLQEEDKARWLERAELYKQIYHELRDVYIQAEQEKSEIQMRELMRRFEQQVVIGNMSLEEFIRINNIKNENLIETLKKQEKALKKDYEKKIKMQKEAAKLFIKTEQEVAAKYKEQQEAKKRNFEDTLNYIASLSTAKNRELAIIGKSAAIASAIIDTYKAANKALASTIPPFNYALAAAVTAAGLANVARIRGVKLAEGGIVLPTAGGTIARIAEANKPEAVIPLHDERTKEALAEAGLGGPTIIIQAGTIVADEVSIREFAEKIDEKLFELKHNNESVS